MNCSPLTSAECRSSLLILLLQSKEKLKVVEQQCWPVLIYGGKPHTSISTGQLCTHRNSTAFLNKVCILQLFPLISLCTQFFPRDSKLDCHLRRVVCTMWGNCSFLPFLLIAAYLNSRLLYKFVKYFKQEGHGP